MRKATCSLLIIACLFAPVLGGDVNSPGKTDPPPCTENCLTASATPTTLESMRQIALKLIISVY